jgi:hypothetical protein
MAAASPCVRNWLSPRRAYNAASGSSTRVCPYNNTLFHRGTVLTWPPTEREQSLDPWVLSDDSRTTIFVCRPKLQYARTQLLVPRSRSLLKI